MRAAQTSVHKERTTRPPDLLANRLSDSTRIIGAKKLPIAPTIVHMPIPAASALPDNTCGGNVQKMGCTARRPIAETERATIAKGAEA